jgi:hypothetical protein
MYTVTSNEIRREFETLDSAIAHAKTLNMFVSITGLDFEIVGKFGVDYIKNGHCPDGVKYDWNKKSRIGRVKKEKVK